MCANDQFDYRRWSEPSRPRHLDYLSVCDAEGGDGCDGDEPRGGDRDARPRARFSVHCEPGPDDRIGQEICISSERRNGTATSGEPPVEEICTESDQRKAYADLPPECRKICPQKCECVR